MGLTLIGQIIFATGAIINVFWLMMVGRFVFGYVSFYYKRFITNINFMILEIIFTLVTVLVRNH